MRIIQSNPKDASGIIIYYKNKVLLQKRDLKNTIFYPGYWGLFGGAKNSNEIYSTNIIREVKEEINIDIDKGDLRYFFKLNIEFPLSLKKTKLVKRYFYIYEIKDIQAFNKNFFLQEGKNKSFFTKNNYLNINITPYDKFALDLFYKYA